MSKQLRMTAFLLVCLLALSSCGHPEKIEEARQTPESWLAPDKSIHQATALELPSAAREVQQKHPELSVQQLSLDTTCTLTVSTPGPRLQPLLILLHELGSDRTELLDESVRFANQGWFCVLPDMPGHGESRSEVCLDSLECCVQAQNMIDLVIAYFRLSPYVDTGRTALLGVSMGGSAAYYYAAYGRFPVSAMCCFISCPDFTRMEDVGAVLNGTDHLSIWNSETFHAYAKAHNPMSRTDRLLSVPLFSWNTLHDLTIPVQSVQELESMYAGRSQVPFSFSYDDSATHAYTPASMNQASRFLAELSAAWK